MSKYCYVVLRGRKKGIFQSYSAVLESINGYPNAYQKGFDSLFEALVFFDKNKPQIEYSELKAYVSGSFDNSKTAAFGLVLKDGDSSYLYSSIIDDPALSACGNYAGEMAAAMFAANKAKELGATAVVIYYQNKIIKTCASEKAKTTVEGTGIYKKAMTRYQNELQISFDKAEQMKDTNRAEILADKALKKRWCYIQSERYINVPDMSAIWTNQT